ncbi:MAG TPA: hypothetical protein VI669_00655 [Vicinamibacteria bacterium]
MKYFRSVSLLLACCALAACSRPATSVPPATQPAGLKVADIRLGRSIAADKTVVDTSDSFRPADTFYVSVRTEGTSSSATLKARWTYEDGQPVDESVQNIAPSGPAVTEFHVSKPDGWPTGSYKVEVLLNGVSAGHKEFKVG